MITASILNNVNGLPTHALLVHFTVVVSTLGAVAGAAYALVPKFRHWLSLPLIFVGLASIVLGILTPATGEKLEARVGEDALLEKHTELGDQMGTIMIAFGLLLIVTMVLVRYRSTVADGAEQPTGLDRAGGIPGRSLRGFSAQPLVATVLTALVLVGSVISGIWIVRTGEAGARSVWHETPATGAQSEGDEPSDES